MVAKWKKYSKCELQEFLDKSNSIQGFMSQIGYKSIAGSNAQTAHFIINTYNLDLSQMEINKKDAISQRAKKRQKNIEDYQNLFVKNSTMKRNTIRKVIIKNNLIPYICSFCGNNGEWLNSTIALELDHKNGVNNDNRLENLRWLCPNCHAITDTYCGKNIQHQFEKTENHCDVCGKIISKRAKKCTKCYHESDSFKEKHRKPCPVDRETLKQLIRHNSFLSIGKMYDVSDNAVRHWCVRLDLPNKKKDIDTIPDSIWENL